MLVSTDANNILFLPSKHICSFIVFPITPHTKQICLSWPKKKKNKTQMYFFKALTELQYVYINLHHNNVDKVHSHVKV